MTIMTVATFAIFFLCLGIVEADESDRPMPSEATEPNRGGVSQLHVLPWMECMDNIHLYFKMRDKHRFEWVQPNPCGFRRMSKNDVLNQVFFQRDGRPKSDSTGTRSVTSNVTKSISVAGDSTAVRMFVYSYNTYFDPKTKMQSPKAKRTWRYNFPITGIANNQAPESITNAPSIMEGGADPPTPVRKKAKKRGNSVTSELRFYKVLYVSEAGPTIVEAIKNAKGGALILVLGNWDLDWKLKKNEPMPGLNGPVQNFDVATDYWVKFVRLMFIDIARALRDIDPSDRPVVMIREQFLPFCFAARFVRSNRKFRECNPFLRPVAVPMYRQVLHSLAWSLGIPVIPSDQLFRNNYQFCGATDGIHLDVDCYPFVQQLLWNSIRLMESVRDTGFGTSNCSTTGPQSGYPPCGPSTLRQGEWQQGIQGAVEDLLERPVAGVAKLPIWSTRSFINPEVFDSWRRGFKRKAPRTIDSSVVLDQPRDHWAEWRAGTTAAPSGASSEPAGNTTTLAAEPVTETQPPTTTGEPDKKIIPPIQTMVPVLERTATSPSPGPVVERTLESSGYNLPTVVGFFVFTAVVVGFWVWSVPSAAPTQNLVVL